MRIPDLLRRSARLYPGRPAVQVVDGPSVSYRDLLARVESLAASLRSRGVMRGDRIALMAGNSLPVFDVYLAAALLGAIVVPLNTRLTEPEIAYILEDAEPVVAVVDPAHRDVTKDFESSGLQIIETGAGEYEAAVTGEPLSDDPSDETDTTLLIYTSGTTGRPKGVCLSQRALVFNGLTLCLVQDQRHEDVFMTTTPLYHAATATRVTSMLTDGQTHVVMPEFDVQTFLRAVAEYRVTSTVLVPTQLQRICASPEVQIADLSSLRLIVYGAAPSSAELVRQAQATFDCGLYQGYGLTEATTNLTGLLPEDHRSGDPARLGSCGRPVPGVLIELRNDGGSPVRAGESGEIWVRSEKVMTGYWRNPGATGEAIVNGWLRTGDLAREDDDGYLYIVGRSKDMIISGGVNIYPREVEGALAAHDLVKDAAVVGVPDPEWGEVPVAFVIAVPGASLSTDELADHCRGTIASIKCPRRFELVAEFPRTAVGKVRKNVLREIALSQISA